MAFCLLKNIFILASKINFKRNIYLVIYWRSAGAPLYCKYIRSIYRLPFFSSKKGKKTLDFYYIYIFCV
jgi:hypothetical protein